MKKEKAYNINLNHLTAGEYFSYKDSFNDYRKAVIAMLSVKDDFLFEDDLLKKYIKDSAIQSQLKGGKLTMEIITESFPDRFVRAGNRPKKKGDKEFIPAWLDLWKDYIITPEDFLFDLFFIYRLRQTDLLEIDNLLNYSLEKYYDNRPIEFVRFLKLAIRKHNKKLLQPEQTETVNEWISEREKQPTLEGLEKTSLKIKSKVERERGDNLTRLNQQQTALLFPIMQKAKIFLSGIQNIDPTHAGTALSILSGWSEKTLRQSLGKDEIKQILNDKKNLTELHHALTRAITVIDEQLRSLQKSGNPS